MANLLTRKDAAARLGISVVTLDEARRCGHIAFIQRKEGGKVFFSEDAIAEYLARYTHPVNIKHKSCGETYRRKRI